jgi:NAD(P)-dependent dehydrogenase (short-subunit alcohol dehydrogenase family)
MGDWDDRVVIITGASGGVGRTVTARWLAAGARILAVGQGQQGLDALRTELPADTLPRFATFAGDIATEDGAAGMAEAAQSAFGTPADTLIHLAGGFDMGQIDAPDAPKTWEKMLAVNLDSAFYTYRAVLPGMRARKGGWIVGLGSRAALRPFGGGAAYAASKAGLIALTQALSEESKGDGVHVNVILASTIDTPVNRAAMGEGDAPKWVRPDDIADATLHLCSERARAVHGATLELYAEA